MRERGTVSLAVLATAIVGVLAVASGIAGAHSVRFDDRVTIRTNPAFHGRVVSQKPGCERQRRVQVFREETGPDGLFASTRTDNSGRWEMLVSQLTGDFYAKIKRRNIGSGGHEHVCRRDRSKSVHVQAPPP